MASWLTWSHSKRFLDLKSRSEGRSVATEFRVVAVTLDWCGSHAVFRLNSLDITVVSLAGASAAHLDASRDDTELEECRTWASSEALTRRLTQPMAAGWTGDTPRRNVCITAMLFLPALPRLVESPSMLASGWTALSTWVRSNTTEWRREMDGEESDVFRWYSLHQVWLWCSPAYCGAQKRTTFF